MRHDWPDWLMYVLGVAFLSFVGFFCPWWFLGFAPLGAGLIYAALLLNVVEEVPRGSTPTQRRD